MLKCVCDFLKSSATGGKLYIMSQKTVACLIFYMYNVKKLDHYILKVLSF